MSTEVYRNWTILVTMPNKVIHKQREFAVSKWQAIDKAFTKLQELQPDRRKYKVKKRMLKLR